MTSLLTPQLASHVRIWSSFSRLFGLVLLIPFRFSQIVTFATRMCFYLPVPRHVLLTPSQYAIRICGYILMCCYEWNESTGYHGLQIFWSFSPPLVDFFQVFISQKFFGSFVCCSASGVEASTLVIPRYRFNWQIPVACAQLVLN